MTHTKQQAIEKARLVLKDLDIDYYFEELTCGSCKREFAMLEDYLRRQGKKDLQARWFCKERVFFG